jgi:hypothetical protein
MIRLESLHAKPSYFGHVWLGKKYQPFSCIYGFESVDSCKHVKSFLPTHKVGYIDKHLTILKPAIEPTDFFDESFVIDAEKLEDAAIYAAIYNSKICLVQDVNLSNDNSFVYMRTSQIPNIIVPDELIHDAMTKLL